MASARGVGPAVCMVAPDRERCGVADYTRDLTRELRPLLRSLTVVPAEQYAAATDTADIRHVQHEYFLFGGVAPWRNRFGALAAQLRRPVVLTVHEIVPTGGGVLRSLAIRVTNRTNLRHPCISRWIVHTEVDRNRLANEGVPLSCIDVVRHGVPSRKPATTREEARSRWDVTSRFVLCLPGFLARRKGHLAALQAMAELPEDVLLLIAGGQHPDDRTTYADEVARAAAPLVAGGRARITGYLSDTDLEEALLASDLVLAPFTDVSGSGSMALTLSLGRPILASDLPQHREIVADTPGALELVNVEEPAALASAIDSLRATPARLDALAAGSAAYAARHTYARAAQETVGVYERAMRGFPPCG